MLRPKDEYFDTNRFKVNVQGADTEWCFRVYPNGFEKDKRVAIYPCLAKGPFPITAEYYLHILDRDGQKRASVIRLNTFKSFGFGRGWGILHDKLISPENGYLQDDTLNVLFDLRVLGKEISSSGSSKLEVSGDGSKEALKKISASFNMEKLSDFVVKCGAKEFKCHKLILACGSPVFEAMIMSNMKEGNESELNIDDFDEDTIESLLRYIYFDKVASLDKQAESLLAAADKYDLAGLKAVCEWNLAQRVNVDNAIDLLLLADMHNATELKRFILEYISGSGAAITQKRENFEKLENNPELLEEIFLKSTL